ncbi:MAG: acireductone synthase [Candidatus Acidiferrales bacterium]
MPAPFDPAAVRAILLDIEGTTTPLEFVYNVLFPFARARLRAFLEVRASDPQICADIEALRHEHAADAQRAATMPPPQWPETPQREIEAASAYAWWLMDHDRKSTPLKSLQGKIWQAGYESGGLRGEVYPDVPPALARWKQQGRRIAIFSSGSVQAQQLLFRYSAAGDLTSYIDAYFDTTTGPKSDAASYRSIAAALVALDTTAGRPAATRQTFITNQILFISDVPAELDAAHSAGLLTGLCVRPGANPSAQPHHPVLHTFDGVFM